MVGNLLKGSVEARALEREEERAGSITQAQIISMHVQILF